MGLQSPFSLTTTLDSLDAIGVAIVWREQEWFIEFDDQAVGPYDTPERALKACTRWLTEREKKVANEQKALWFSRTLRD